MLLLKWVSKTCVMGTWVFLLSPPNLCYAPAKHNLNPQITVFCCCFFNFWGPCSFSSLLQVVDLIREVPHRTRLLVVDRETDGFLRSRGLPCTEDLAMEMGNLSPRPSPGPTPSNSPLPRGISPLMSKVFHLSSLAASSPTDSAALGGAEASSETSSEASDAEVCRLWKTTSHFS